MTKKNDTELTVAESIALDNYVMALFDRIVYVEDDEEKTDE